MTRSTEERMPVLPKTLTMPPEVIQGYILLVYSILFLGLALLLGILKRKRSTTLTEQGPCSVYLRMRCEVAKAFDKRDLNAKWSKFDEIKIELRY